MNGCDKKACQGKLETAGGLSVYIDSSCFDADIRQYSSIWLSVVYRVSSDTRCGFIIQRSRQVQDHYASSWLIMSRLLVETANLELDFATVSPEIGVRWSGIQDQGYKRRPYRD